MALFALWVAGSSISSFQARSDEFAKSPTVPFSVVAQSYGFGFNRYASALGVTDGSLLASDMGGTLYYSQLKVYDLGGLTDKVIGRTLWNHSAAFHDYVLGVLKPTFIHLHNPWDVAADLDSDPRFRRDYVAIHESLDATAQAGQGLSVFVGNYVRKDALADTAMLQELQALPSP